MRIYTRTGDTGETGLFGGQRVGKDALRVEAFGTVDELNAVLGIALSQGLEPELHDLLSSIQSDLFAVGADLATPDDEATRKGRIRISRIGAERPSRLETLIDRYEAELLPLQSFILPGGHPLAATLHLARAICRRAERCCVRLAREQTAPDASGVNPEIVRYLNRLSDLLFVLARVANHRHGMPDIPWQPNAL